MTAPKLLSDVFLDAPMQHYFRRKFSDLPPGELALRIEEALRFLFISHACSGPIPVSKEIDDVWHAWILQTQEYMALCDRLPTGRYIHHSSNDYLSYLDPAVGEDDDLSLGVKMLALYAANFGPFDAARAQHWLLARHLLERGGWTVAMLNDWLLGDAHDARVGMDAAAAACC